MKNNWLELWESKPDIESEDYEEWLLRVKVEGTSVRNAWLYVAEWKDYYAEFLTKIYEVVDTCDGFDSVGCYDSFEKLKELRKKSRVF